MTPIKEETVTKQDEPKDYSNNDSIKDEYTMEVYESSVDPHPKNYNFENSNDGTLEKKFELPVD